MELPSVLMAIIVILAVAVVCISIFEKLGFGAILGFIITGIILGPHTPGLVPVKGVDELQNISELGVVLFMFTVGLEMQPQKVWSMRRLIFGLGSAQMIVTSACLSLLLIFLYGLNWESSLIVSLALSMSSTAIVMATLGERGEVNSEHGKATFSVLMAQDLWIVPVMALVPILAHTMVTDQGTPWFDKGMQVVGVLAGIVFIGRFVLPFLLGRLAHKRQMDVFGVLVFLAILSAAWAVDHVGVSMTLGSFLLGMLLSASDYRFQIESMVSPFKQTLMALFFISVGMSIDVGAIAQDWQSLLVFVPLVLAVKGLVLVGLVILFGLRRSVAIKTGFYLSQVGEFSFVLLATATLTGLLTDEGHTLAMLVVATSMILTPLMVKLGNYCAEKFSSTPAFDRAVAQPLAKHVVIVGYDEVGQLIDLMLDKAGIPHIAFERDIDVVIRGKKIGRNVHFGDMYSPITQEAAGLNKASAVYISAREIKHAKALAVTLHGFYPSLEIFVRVGTLKEQGDLVAKGIKNAGTGYIESTLVRGSMLLKQLGVTEKDVSQLVSSLQSDNYDLIRSEYAKFDG